LPPLVIPPRFKKRLHKKTPQMAGAILECVQRLGSNPRHQGLHTHEVGVIRGRKVFEAYVDDANRVSFHWEGAIIVIRAHCNHDLVKHGGA
jgi:hypothetical protein